MIATQEFTPRPDTEILLPAITPIEHTDGPLTVVEFNGQQANGIDNGTLIVHSPWSEYVTRTDAMDRNRAIAAATNTRLLAVDLPGFGDNDSRISKKERRRISDGDLSEASKLQWQSLAEIIKFDDALTLAGYSLGATAVASSLRKAPENVTVANVILWEAVSQPQSFGSLLGKFASENKDWSAYFKDCPDWAVKPGSPKNMLRIAARPGVHVAYAEALTNANLSEDFAAAVERGVVDERTQITIVNGSNSRLSPEANNEKLARSIESLGGLSVKRLILLGQSHGMVDSLPRMIDTYRELFS